VMRLQWELISKIFNEAAKLDPSERSAYLDRVCPDSAIRAEVESLLAHHKPEPLLGVYSSFDGVVLGHYRMIEPIGDGSMGQLYKAMDLDLDRIVAAKLLAPWVTGVIGFRERLLYEAKCASALNHPNIVTVHELVCEKGVDFIVMEYVQGTTLQRLIPPGGLSVELALDYAIEITAALETAHAAGILHGDLKPLNIMVTDDNRVKLLDFGLARALAPDPAVEQQPQQFGTRAYMAPECLTNRSSDERSEIFSVGLILHQMLGGKHPFGTGTPNEISESIQLAEPMRLPARVPDCLCKAVYRCLEKNPENRFESIQHVMVELQDCADECYDENNLPQLPILPTPVDQIDVNQANAITAQINYANAIRSRNALDQLKRVLEAGVPALVRDAISHALKEVILTVEPDTNGIALSIRNIRKQTLNTLKLAVEGNIRKLFSDGDFEAIDLYGMDFSGAKLSGLCFRDCFLAHADFKGADLKGCSLAGTWLRNANFLGANIEDADFTGADWFNATGLREHQLASAQLSTFMDCPADLDSLHHFLALRYRYSFKAWGIAVQRELTAAWNEYLRPGGLREFILVSRGKRH
jgi:serine/threonine protein kinase